MQTDSASGIRNHAERYNFSAFEHSFREFAPSCDAEKLSCLCLQNGAVSFEDFASLVAILPPDNELAFAGHDSKTFTTGAYIYSNMAGLRSNVYKYPATTKLLASVLCTMFPSKCFTSVGLFRQLQAPPHVDTNNQPGCPNLLLPASRFQNGAVWVEGPGNHEFLIDGHMHTGSLLDVAQGPCELDAQCLHATCKWMGTRVILVGFCVKNSASLDPALATRLEDLGFQLPAGRDCKKPRLIHHNAEPSSPLKFSPHTPRAVSEAAPPSTSLGFSPFGFPMPPVESTTDCCAESVPHEYTVQGLFPDHVAPMVIEVFAGAARLSQACQAVGFRTLPGDKSSKRSRFAIHHLDLTQPDDVQALLDIITLEADNLELVHLAPPCGTSSAARNKPFPQAVQNGRPVPQPLRSPTEPQGLSTLTGVDLVRVQQANALYQAVGIIARHCIALGVRVSVENPLNSLAWLCDGLDDLFRLDAGLECLPRPSSCGRICIVVLGLRVGCQIPVSSLGG